jgi:hypothetical protein
MSNPSFNLQELPTKQLSLSHKEDILLKINECTKNSLLFLLRQYYNLFEVIDLHFQ